MADPDIIIESGKCQCGQLVFDLSERRVGEVLGCSACGRKYRFLGAGAMRPLSATESFDAPLAGIGVQNSKPPAKKLRAPQPVVAAQRTPDGRTAVRRKAPSGPPGGILPMVGFIVFFNALAFTALAVVFPKGDDGLRHAIWDDTFTFSGKAWWVDVLALVAGHLMGFVAWGFFVHYLRERARTKAALKPETK